MVTLRVRPLDSSATEPDDALVGDLLAVGDHDALALAYERWASLVHGLAVEALGDRGACDVTSTVFVEAWQSRDRFRDRAVSPRTCLLDLTRRAIDDQLVRRRPTEITDDLLDAPDGSPPRPGAAGLTRVDVAVPRTQLQE